MNPTGSVFQFLPVFVKAAEAIYGARKGEIKKQEVTDLIFSVLRLKNPAADTPQAREAVGKLIDGVVATLNAEGLSTAASQ